MEFEQQAFVPDEQTVKQREELKKMTNKKSAEIDMNYETKAIMNGCMLNLSSMEKKGKEL
ncbi:MAG: hypothetical protein IJT14_00385 [Rickettsiales bacterium]|nr:hypothetical protein [Rickettsiales bacterium]